MRREKNVYYSKNIFKAKDEKYFREIEEKITLEVLDTFPAVIALGGGAFINKNIRDKVLKRSNKFLVRL